MSLSAHPALIVQPLVEAWSNVQRAAGRVERPVQATCGLGEAHGAWIYTSAASTSVLPHEDEGAKPRQDRIYFRFDRNRDATTSQIWVNSQGATVDVRSTGRDADFKWDAEATTATYVGDDFWSLECELRWDPIYHPRPVSGEFSRVNFIRLFRTVEYSQSVAEYDKLEAAGFLV